MIETTKSDYGGAAAQSPCIGHLASAGLQGFGALDVKLRDPDEIRFALRILGEEAYRG